MAEVREIVIPLPSDEVLLRQGEACLRDVEDLVVRQTRKALTERLATLRAAQPEHDLDRDPFRVHLALCLCGCPLYHAGGQNPMLTLVEHQTEMKRLNAAR